MDPDQIILNSEFYERQAVISKLLNKLEQDKLFEGKEAQQLKTSVDDLISQISDNQIDFQTDLRAILESFRHGLITPDMLERMVRDEQMRSDFLIRIANTIAGELEALFMQVEKLSAYTMPPELQDTMTMKMQAVMDSVDLFSQLVQTPGKKIRNVVLKASVVLEKSAAVPAPIITPEVIQLTKQPPALPQPSPTRNKVNKRRPKEAKKEVQEEREEPSPARPAPAPVVPKVEQPHPVNDGAAAMAAAMAAAAAAAAAAAKYAPKPYPVARTTLPPQQRAITPEPKLRVVARVDGACQTDHSGPIPSSQPIIVQAAPVKPPAKPIITIPAKQMKKGTIKADDASDESSVTAAAAVPAVVSAPAPPVQAPAPAPATTGKSKKKVKEPVAAAPKPARRSSTKISQTDEEDKQPPLPAATAEFSCGTGDDLEPPVVPVKELLDGATQTSRAPTRPGTRALSVTDSLDDEEGGVVILPPPEDLVPEPPAQSTSPPIAASPPVSLKEDVVEDRPELATLPSLNLHSEYGDDADTDAVPAEDDAVSFPDPEISIPPPTEASPEKLTETLSDESSSTKDRHQSRRRSSFNTTDTGDSGWMVNNYGLALKANVSTTTATAGSVKSSGRQLAEFDALRGQTGSQAVADIITWLQQVDVALGGSSLSGQQGQGQDDQGQDLEGGGAAPGAEVMETGTVTGTTVIFPEEVTHRKQEVLERANEIMRLYTVLEEREQALESKTGVLENEIRKRVTERIAKEILAMRKAPRDGGSVGGGSNAGSSAVSRHKRPPLVPQGDEFDFSSGEEEEDEDRFVTASGGVGFLAAAGLGPGPGPGEVHDRDQGHGGRDPDSGDEEEIKLKKRLRRMRRRRLREQAKWADKNSTAPSIRAQPPDGANKLLLSGRTMQGTMPGTMPGTRLQGHPHQRPSIRQHALFPLAPPPLRTDGIVAAARVTPPPHELLLLGSTMQEPPSAPLLDHYQHNNSSSIHLSGSSGINRVMSAMSDRLSLGSPSSRPPTTKNSNQLNITHNPAASASAAAAASVGGNQIIRVLPPQQKPYSIKEVSTEDAAITSSRPGSPNQSVSNSDPRDPGIGMMMLLPAGAGGGSVTTTTDSTSVGIGIGAEGNSTLELKVQDFGNGLQTKAYRVREVRSFSKELASADNPLLAIYNEYRGYISEIQRARLLRAASTGENATYEYNVALITSIFGAFVGPLQEVDGALVKGIMELLLCEKIASNLLTIYESADLANELFNQSLVRMRSKLGQLEVLRLWADVQLVEFRAIFEEVRAKNFVKSPGLLQGSKEFDSSLKLFVSAQGHLVELKNRVSVLQARTSKFNNKPVGADIFINESSSLAGGGGAGSLMNMMMMMPSSYSSSFGSLGIGGMGGGAGSGSTESAAAVVVAMQRMHEVEQHCAQLEQEIQGLTQDLEESEAEIKSLTEQLFDADLEQDRTPGTLMFFSALHDTNIIPSMQQMLLQLSQLKGLADCSTHMDFTTLRKRLLACCNAAPVLDSFIRKFQNMHKGWVQHRLNVFTVRNVAGGDADAASICPICSIDIREPAKAEARVVGNAAKLRQGAGGGAPPTSHFRSQYSKHPKIFPSRSAMRLEKLAAAGGGSLGGGSGGGLGRSNIRGVGSRSSMPVVLPPMSGDAMRKFQASFNLSDGGSEGVPPLMSQSFEM